MATIPDTKWVSSAGVDIAYQTFGQGDVDLVVVPSWVGNIELFWDLPEAARMFEQLGTFCRVVLFDKRGTGISDRATVPTLEERAEDIGVVMDAVGVTGAALAGWGDAALIAATFAATHPERVQALLLGSFAPRGAARDEEGDGVDQTTLDGVTIAIEQGWGEALLAPIVAPSLAHDERFLAWWRRWERLSGTPASAAAEFRWEQQIDARALLPFIQAPTLILHRRDAAVVDREVVRRAAEAIPNAHYVELPGADSIPVAGDVEAVISEIEEFLTGSRALTDTNRVLATVLFTDIVNSTERAQALGDRSWGDLLDAHNSRVRRSVNQFGGTEIDTAGDGFFITFDGPARAVRCGISARDAISEIGLQIRAGVHTGEVERRGNELAGLGVHVGARVAETASPSEVLVTRTVKDLVLGSGIAFEDRGTHSLKGVPDRWHLYAALGT